MLRPTRMCRIDCLIPDEFEDKLTLTLQSKGIAQVDGVPQEDQDKFSVTEDEAQTNLDRLTKCGEELKSLIRILNPYKPKTGFLEGLLGVSEKTPGEGKPVEARDLLPRIKEYLEGEGRQLKRLYHDKKEAEENLRKDENEFKKHRILLNAPVSTNNLGETQFLYTALGSVKTNKLGVLTKNLNQVFGSNYLLEIHQSLGAYTPITLTVPKDNAAQLHDAVKQSLDLFQDIPDVGEIGPWVESKKTSAQKLRQRIDEIETQLASLSAKNLSQLYTLLDLVENEVNRNRVLSLFYKTEKTAFMRLWTSKTHGKQVVSHVRDLTDNLCAVDVQWKPENAPILLENPKYLSSFEMLTRLFALPRYNQIDPTLIIAPTFSLFFGLMLTDVFYGLFLIITSYLIYKKYGPRSRGLADLMIIFIACGASSMFFGALTGSYLGDFLGTYVFGGTPQDIALWLDPLNGSNSITLLAVACMGGFLHIYLGYLLGAIDNIKKGNIKDAVTKNLSWYVFAAGIILMVLTQYPSTNPILPETLYPLSMGLAFLGLALLFWGLGLIFVIEVISLVGSILSYARLIALGLTTAGIALAFNFLSNIALETPYVGVVLAAIIFILGHIINILINTLGAFVHSLRLHYVEFFGAFYEGGGREFSPLNFKKKYTL